MELIAGNFMGGGAILLAILITATEVLNWPRKTHYLWAALALIWGIIALF